MNRKKAVASILIGIVITVCSLPYGKPKLLAASSTKTETTVRQNTELLYGVTLNDIMEGDINAICSSLKALCVRPTVRIVLSPDTPAQKYVSRLKRIHRVADIMLCPVDSSYMDDYPDAASYLKRFQECDTWLADDTDIWEVGNEVNGEGWFDDDPALVSSKIYSAYTYLKEKGYITELTPYGFRPGDQSITMEEWLEQNIPSDMKNGLDLVLVSYYDEDNGGKHENWTTMFSNLEKTFPNARVGFGECGFSTPRKAGKALYRQMDRYYLKSTDLSSRFAGGYFWWYYQQDCVPYRHNKSWNRLNQDLKKINK